MAIGMRVSAQALTDIFKSRSWFCYDVTPSTTFKSFTCGKVLETSLSCVRPIDPIYLAYLLLFNPCTDIKASNHDN